MSQPSPALDAADRVDLHMHTIHSDGHWSPPDLFDHLAREGFRLVAVTDHDSTETVPEMVALGAERGITVISGVEMTTNWDGQILHLLCYGWRAGGQLAGVAARTLADQLANAHAVTEELERRGYAFPRMAEVLADHGGAVTHPLDNMTLVLKHGYAADRPAALALLTEAGHRTVSAPLAEVVAAAHADGGVAVVAHPGRTESGAFGSYSPDALTAIRATVPLDGIEVFYPTYIDELRARYAAYAHETGLLASSGSDSHGPRQRYPIPYPAAEIAPLLARLGYPVR